MGKIVHISGYGAPTNGSTGANTCGYGSYYYDITNDVMYQNLYGVNGFANPFWVPVTANFQQISGTITSANIIGTGAGQFGHANGYPMLSAAGAHVAAELISCLIFYDFSVAAYTGGGNVSVNWSGGGAALTGVVSAANSMAAATDKAVIFYPLTTAGVALVENAGLNLVAASAFTQPGTAAGVIRYVLNFRTHNTGF
jgi:hypothetical protein